MGDVRRTASDGLYAGMRGGKDRIEGHAATTYRDQYRAVGLGLDRKVGGNWIVGGAFEALEGNQTTHNNGASASGRSTGQNLRLYATWFADNGVYADVVACVGRFNQKLSTKMLDGTPVRGSTSALTCGASVEAGGSLCWQEQAVGLPSRSCSFPTSRCRARTTRSRTAGASKRRIRIA